MSKAYSASTIESFEKGPVRRSLFRNGAVSLFHQFKGMESACAHLYFLAGSVFESEKEEGIAHLIEHMLFKEEAAGSLVRNMEELGADINAYTYKEHVCFELECPAALLPKFLPDFLSLFMSPVFLDKDLALEKKVVLQELREDKDDHETEGVEHLYKRNFPRPLGHSIGGGVKQVRSFGVKDLSRFYKKYYRPERMVLSVVSGKRCDALEDILEQSFSEKAALKNLTGNKPWRLRPRERFSKLEHIRSRLKRPMESSILFYSFDGPSVLHRDYYNFLVLDEYLLGGMSSKLFTELREKSAYVYGLGSALNSYAAAGSYMMIFHTLKKNIGKVREKVESSLEALAREEIPAQEIEKIKKRIVMGWRMSFDDLVERNEYLAEIELLGEKDFSLARQTGRLNLVTSNSLQKLVKKILNREHSLLSIGP